MTKTQAKTHAVKPHLVATTIRLLTAATLQGVAAGDGAETTTSKRHVISAGPFG